MKKLTFLLSVILLMFIISGCSSVKRFKSVSYKAQDNTLVDMDLFGSRLTMDETEPADKNMWDLSASAQTQLIRILNERYPDNEQFISALSNEYLISSDITSLDLTRKKLRMVFTISKDRDYTVLTDASGRFSPADRIEYLSFSLEIPEMYNLQFTGWNKYVTEYGEIDIADVSFSRSYDLDLKGSGIQNADAGGKSSLNRSEDQEVRSRYLKLNGSISDRRIMVEEEGTREIDLTGNVIADVSLEFKGFPERITIPLFVGQGQGGPGVSGVAALRFVDVLVPRMEEAPDTIKGLLQLDYIYRHVQSGWKTYQEWDDQVEYYSGNVKKEIPLFTKKEYLPIFYTIGTEIAGKTTMKVRTQTGAEYPLQFKNITDAGRFYDWLTGLTVKDVVMIGKNTLLFDGAPVTPRQIDKEEMKVMTVY
jgi:hypothetical protein